MLSLNGINRKLDILVKNNKHNSKEDYAREVWYYLEKVYGENKNIEMPKDFPSELRDFISKG